jgi:hypothetical protein
MAYKDLLGWPRNHGTAYTYGILRELGGGSLVECGGRGKFSRNAKSLFFFLFSRPPVGQKMDQKITPGKAAWIPASTGDIGHSRGSAAG